MRVEKRTPPTGFAEAADGTGRPNWRKAKFSKKRLDQSNAIRVGMSRVSIHLRFTRACRPRRPIGLEDFSHECTDGIKPSESNERESEAIEALVALPSEVGGQPTRRQIGKQLPPRS